MTEPLRATLEGEGSADADRDALIERLLLAGLDHYFEGRYEQAINVWTRVAFLERGHARARAYIERARGAVAERQRESDELLQHGLDAYRSGDLTGAREMLTRAVADGGSETALVFLQRLGVAEAGHAAAAPFPPSRGDGAIGPGRYLSRGQRGSSPAPSSTNWFSTVLASVSVGAAILLAAQPIASWLGDRPVMNASVSPRAAEALPVLRAAETRLARAEEMYADGRLREALQLLAAVGPADPLRGSAEALIARIQADLLATVPTSYIAAGEATR